MKSSIAESRVASDRSAPSIRFIAGLAGVAALTCAGCMPHHSSAGKSPEATVMPAPFSSSATHPAYPKQSATSQTTARPSRPAHLFATADKPTWWKPGFEIEQSPGLVAIYNFGIAPSGKTAIAVTPHHTNGSVTTDHIRVGDSIPRVLLECQGKILVAQNPYNQLRSFAGNLACQDWTLTMADKQYMPTLAELTYGGPASGHFMPAQPQQHGS